MPETVRFFWQEALQDGGRVLVHCMQGVSRSAALVLAYLMASPRMKKHLVKGRLEPSEQASLRAMLAWLQERRPIANPNLNFCKQVPARAYTCPMPPGCYPSNAAALTKPPRG